MASELANGIPIIYILFWIISIFINAYHCHAESFFKDVTAATFKSDAGMDGYIAAYGDYSNDKITDIFIISPGKFLFVTAQLQLCKLRFF